jgi:hypothetical protein
MSLESLTMQMVDLDLAEDLRVITKNEHKRLIDAMDALKERDRCAALIAQAKSRREMTRNNVDLHWLSADERFEKERDLYTRVVEWWQSID